jgi:outer membrane protein assembly factor BamA
MIKTFVFLLTVILLQTGLISGQAKEKEKMKEGWSFGFFPAFGYDPNTGVKYGGILKLYDYGDGSSYPRFNQNIHFELSRTSKGSGINQLVYDTRTLIPGIRMMAEASYLTEKALNFYGFNGYNSYYNPGYTNSSDPLYRSAVFYHMERAMIKTRLEFIGKWKGNYLKWFGGIEYLNIRVDTVDVNNINKGRDKDDLLPFIGGGLYGNYIKWGLIPGDQADGGQTFLFKIGAMYDTRDRETNPMKGIYADLQLLLVPGFLSDGYSYSRIAFTHRQYFTLLPQTINLACRFSYQAGLTGEMPFYMLPLVFNSAPQVTLSGLGGARTLRGMLRNRLVGEDFIYGNIELRWKLFRTIILNQNFYIALAGFADAGMITGKYKLPEITDPEGIAWLALGDKEELHVTYGGGAHFVINDNFVITMDYGWAADPRDGSKGTYIGVGYLF